MFYRLIALAALLCALPAFGQLTSADIGAVGAAGSTAIANGVYTVRASGADVWGTQDEFRFAYAQMTGDVEVTARVDSVTATHPWTKAGVMIRETLGASSSYAYTLVSAGNGVDFQYRAATGAAAIQVGQDAAPRAPYWVRLRRTGNVFAAFVSADGQTWRQHGGNVTIAMGATVYAGLAITSHLDGSIATAVLSSVSTGGTIPQPPPDVTYGSAALTWTPPTLNVDGSPLQNLAGYRVYWGTVQGTYPNSVTLNNPGLTSYVVENLTPATWYFVVTAVSAAGVESPYSNVASKTVVGNPAPTPVDCVVSAWTPGAVTPATCPASGMQSRVDARTIVTQPANGGAACPALTQTVALTCVPPPPTDPCVTDPLVRPTNLAWPTSRTGSRTLRWDSPRTIVRVDYGWPLGQNQRATWTDDRGCTVTVSR